MTVTVFGYLILISKDFTILILRFLLSFSFDWEDISNTQEVFDHISKDFEVRQKSKRLSCLIYYLKFLSL